jgi:hypothetical protein
LCSLVRSPTAVIRVAISAIGAVDTDVAAGVATFALLQGRILDRDEDPMYMVKSKEFLRPGPLPTRIGATWSAFAQRDGAAIFAASRR